MSKVGGSEKYREEKEVYAENIADWASKYTGQFVLIKGREVCGFFTSYPDAVERGYQSYGLDGFFVKQISIIQDIHFMPPLMRAHDAVLHSAN